MMQFLWFGDRRPRFFAILAVALLVSSLLPSMAAAQDLEKLSTREVFDSYWKNLQELAKDSAAGDCDEQSKVIVAHTGGDWCSACKRWKNEELEKVLDKGYSVRFVRETKPGPEVPYFETPGGYTTGYLMAEWLPSMLTGEPGNPTYKPENETAVSAETLPCPPGSKSCPIQKPSSSPAASTPSSSASSRVAVPAAGNVVASTCPCPPGCNCSIDCPCRIQPSILSNPSCVDCPRAVAVPAQPGQAVRSVQTFRDRGRFFWGRR